MSIRDPRYVTRSFLPPLEEYVELLEGIWQRGQLTNNGPLVQELESRLAEYLGVPQVLAICNGALGLHLAIKALGIDGQVITTPFSYVATTSCVLWEGAEPVFVDIEPDTLTINPALISAAITPRTQAILATHVYGNPCDVEAIDAVAKQHDLAVIYDAAHAFGVQYRGRSILEYGDVSMVSLHATKVFHTAEGGLLVASSPKLTTKLEWMRRFGHDDKGSFHGVGTNAKMSELHAAIGVAQLRGGYVDQTIQRRRQVSQWYDELLFSSSTELSKPRLREYLRYNYAYYPVLFRSQKALLETKARLESHNVMPRRYFYPALNRLPKLLTDQSCSVAEDIAQRVLCLPLAYDITRDELDDICRDIY